MRALIPLFALMTLCGTELTTRDGRTLAYDEISCEPKHPKVAIVLKSGTSITTLALAEVDPAALPAIHRDAIAAYTAKQKEEGLLLYENEWIDRDGHLLKTDPRFAYPRRFHAVGRNRLTVVNKGDTRLTIGIRPEGEAPDRRRGYEVSVKPFKDRTIQLPDGGYVLLFVAPSPDGTALAVRRGKPVALAAHHFTLTMGGDEPGTFETEEAGFIMIPPEMR